MIKTLEKVDFERVSHNNGSLFLKMKPVFQKHNVFLGIEKRFHFSVK